MVRRILSSLEKPLSRLYLMFLSDALPIINIFNKTMQLQSPTIHFLIREVQSFVRKLLLRFLAPSVVQGVQISTINLDDSEQYLPLDEVFIGEKAKSYLLHCDEELATGDIRSFQDTCRQFWIAAAKYAMKKLPIESDFLTSMSWLHPFSQDYTNARQVLLVASHLPQVIKEDNNAQLAEEFMDYCTSELPPELIPLNTKEIDVYWHRIGLISDASGQLRYPLLSKLAKAVLTIPHGNADVERMFSHLGLNKTKMRTVWAQKL